MTGKREGKRALGKKRGEEEALEKERKEEEEQRKKKKKKKKKRRKRKRKGEGVVPELGGAVARRPGLPATWPSCGRRSGPPHRACTERGEREGVRKKRERERVG